MAKSLRFMLKPLSHVFIITRHKSQLNKAVREAERMVGYSTSFLNLRWLLTDEIANVALHIRKLVGVNHPLLQTARKLFMGNTIPNWGVIVLLISKAAGWNNTENENDKDRIAGVLNSQRVLAEVTEMIRMSFIIHKSIINIDSTDYADVLNFGNQLAILSGDFLLSKSFKELAHIYNTDVSFVMSSTLRDLVESEFIGNKPCRPITTEHVDIQDVVGCDPISYKAPLGNPRVEWVYRNILGGASVLAKACQSALKLAKHPESMQQLGYVVGANIALAWQTKIEHEAFISSANDASFSLVSAPVMLHLEQDSSLFDLIDAHQIDHNKLHKRVSLGNSLKATKLLQNEFCSNALKALSKLPKSDARLALENIVNTIK